MKILFLDTETSGLRYQEDEIIEIGGVIVEWKAHNLEFISAFESLVKPNKQVGEQTTRITGIDNRLLSSAPTRAQVHESWFDWLQEYKDIDCIVGHYIQFDIQFLENEHWFLPPHKIIDTLDLAKIFCPDSEAVNLERLIKKFQLNPNSIIPTKYLSEDNVHHRALYDSGACAALYHFIVKRIYDTSWHPELIPYIQDLYLGVDREFYTGVAPQLSSQQPQSQEYRWSFESQKLSQTEMIGAIDPEEWHSKLSTYRDLPKHIRLAVLQISVLALWKWQGKSTYYHRGVSGNKIISYILQSFKPDRAPEYHWPYVFTLFASIQYLYKQSLNLNSLASTADEMIAILPAENDIIPLLKEFTVQCDFIQFQLKARNILNQWTVYYEVPRSQQEWIRQKFLDMGNLITRLLEVNWSDDAFTEYARADFEKLKQILASPHDIHMRIGHYITLTTAYASDIRDKIDSLVEQRNGVIPTRYSKEQLVAVEHMLGFSPNWSDRVDVKESQQYEVWDGIPDLHDVIKAPESGVKVILCGQNSNLKDCWRVVDQHDMFDSVLVLGEVGSTRKIISRLLAGFKGTVIVRSKDWHQFTSYQKTFEIAQVVHIHPPYWVIDSFWYQQSKHSSDPEEYMSKLKKLRAHGQLLELADRFSAQLTFVRQYIT